MQREGITSGKFKFLAALKACSGRCTIKPGKLIHDQVTRSGLGGDVVIGSTLIDLYAKCGFLHDAHNVFDKLPLRNVVSWNALILGYAQHGNTHHALKLFEKLHEDCINPDKVTYLCILKIYGTVLAVRQGRLIHDQIIKMGLHLDVLVGSALVDMYARCGNLGSARQLFEKLPNKNVVSWNIILAGYAHHGNCLAALQLFEKMEKQGAKPDRVTFLCVLKACGMAGSLHQGNLIHNDIIRSGLESDLEVGNTVINMYTNCGNLEEGRKVFDKLQNRDLVSWNALIAGYLKHENALCALELLKEMQHEGIKPCKFTFSCILKACSGLGAIKQGKHIHDQIIKNGVKVDTILGNTLIDMYVQCGSPEAAHKVLDDLAVRDVLSWNALLAGYARHRNYRLVDQCLKDMQRQGLTPGGGTYTSILAACSWAGSVDEAQKYFNSMQEDCCVTPNNQHFNCMIDLLGRVGCLKEAEVFIRAMPILPDLAGWRSLLTACRTHCNIKLGRQCFDEALQLDPDSSGIYVLMSDIYADACMWEDVQVIKDLRRCAQSWRKPGKAWIQVSNKVQEFVVGDKTHVVSDRIYAKMKSIRKLIENEGYVPTWDIIGE